MRRRIAIYLFCFAAVLPAATADTLERGDPRSTVIGFLQACQKQDYDLASEYLDLRQMPNKSSARGPDIAKKLEAALNSAPAFNAMRLTQNPDGSTPNAPDPPREHVATLRQNGASYTLDLERVSLQAGGPLVWIFSPDTVTTVSELKLSTTAPWLTHYLPPFLVSVEILETPLWVWAALVLAAILLVSLSRQIDRILLPLLRSASERFAVTAHWEWTEALLRPARMILSLAAFRLALELVHPSAIARLYIGRLLEILFVWSVAWCVIRIVDLLLHRVESRMESHHDFSGRSILRLGRRTASVTIVVLAILMILSSWGYNTATLIAGLGVGGIAVALAAQQTIANIFGGISVIGDHPVGIGDFGKFGDLMGTVEDIGMRSTAVRTLNRTLVSIPNSVFAGANLENYSVRDKILFNPTIQIKRNTPDEEVWHLIESLHKALTENKSIELVPTPVRLIGLTAASFNIEIFCYVKTPDIDEFYKIQGQLFLAINDALQSAHLELV